MVVNECLVLEPKQPHLPTPDDWPVFALKDAYVVGQKSGELVSLLSAHKDNHVKVIGRLRKVDPEQRSLVKDPNYRNVTTEIPHVSSFAFAEYDDGSYGFWAAGQAGWFELEEPLPKYKPVFDEMGVGTSMLYFVADKIRRSRKTQFTGNEFNKHIRRIFKDVPSHPAYQDFLRVWLMHLLVLCRWKTPHPVWRRRRCPGWVP